MNRYSFQSFAQGILKIGYTDSAVFLIQRVEEIDTENEPSLLSELAFGQIREYLSGQRSSFDFPYTLAGTPFTQKVWAALQQIPYGETRSYKQLACSIGNPNASRAVGMANRINPLLIVVPCHRAIGSNGKLVGYAGGLEMKKALLSLEQRPS